MVEQDIIAKELLPRGECLYEYHARLNLQDEIKITVIYVNTTIVWNRDFGQASIMYDRLIVYRMVCKSCVCIVQIQETVVGKAASKSAGLMKDIDEQKMKARNLLAEIALPSFVCTHDHSKYLALERDYYNKERAMVNASEANLMQVKSALQQWQKQVEQKKTQLLFERAWLKFLADLDKAHVLFSSKELVDIRRRELKKIEKERQISLKEEQVDDGRRILENCEKELQKAQISLKEVKQEHVQAEIVLASSMRTLSKHQAMDRYYYSKEGEINCGSEANLVTMKSSVLEQCQKQVERARTVTESAESNVLLGSVNCALLTGYSMLGFMTALAINPGRFAPVCAVITPYFVIAASQLSDIVDRERSELERCKKLYQDAQQSWKIEHELDTRIDHLTCTYLKDHGWYYCNREGTRQRNAAEVNRAIIAKRSALQQCQEQVEQARTDVRTAENEIWNKERMMRKDVVVGAVSVGALVLRGRRISAVLMAGAFATYLRLTYQLYVDRLEMCNKDYQRYQDSLKGIEHDFESMQVEMDQFTHLKRPKLVPVEWRYYYRHRHIVLTDVTMNRPEIDLKMNTRLQDYFSKFRSFCFP